MADTGHVHDIAATVETMGGAYCAAADAIWEFAELKFEEHRSSALLADLLDAEGFAVRRGVAGMATAFVAEKGVGAPVIAFLGEYDALAGMHQNANVPEARSDTPGRDGHGCGHNLLGAGSALATAALARRLEEGSLPGTVRFYGCPGEEGGSGKTYLVRAGEFDDVDVALTWHPAPFNGVRSTNNLAVLEYFYRFRGTAAHAANGPHLGRSALDAVELMNVGVNFLREHMPQDCRVHYAITDSGGRAANVVQARAEVLYLVRAPDIAVARALAERVDKVARGAAMMTETEVEIVFDTASSNLVPNLAIEAAMHEVMTALGPVAFDESDRQAAAEIQATLTPEMVQSSLNLYRIGQDVFLDPPIDGSQSLHDGLRLFEGMSHLRSGSSDVGDVSWVVPTAQCWTPTWAIGTVPHTWQVVAQGKSPAAHKALKHAAKTLAGTGYELLTRPDLLEAARSAWTQALAGRSYVSPIPAYVKPPCPENIFSSLTPKTDT